jgi:predicted amidohydrolase YtcJ
VLDSIGPERMADAFPMKAMLDAGIPLTSGSDGPGYWPVDPLRDVGISASRKSRAGSDVAKNQALSVEDALRIFTINAAYSGFEEKIKGSIEVGKLADLAVLAKDPFASDKAQIKDIEVDMTVVDGNIAFERGPAGSMHA